MIRNFRSRALRRFMERGEERRIHPEPWQIHVARSDGGIQAHQDVSHSLSVFRLHSLGGNYAGFWAVTVRANWRVIFRFEDGHAADVDYLDYH